MNNKNETKVWKLNLDVWIAAEDMVKAINGIHNVMRDICDSRNPIQAYESKSVKLDYIES